MYLTPSETCKKLGISRVILQRMEDEGMVRPIILFPDDEKPNRRYRLQDVIDAIEMAKIK